MTSNLANNKKEHRKAINTTIPPILGTQPVCDERLLGLSTKFFRIAILNTGILIFQPISKANTIDSTNLQLSDNKFSIIFFTTYTISYTIFAKVHTFIKLA